MSALSAVVLFQEAAMSTLRATLLATTGLVAVVSTAKAQSCSAPSPAAAAGYTAQTFGGSPTIGQNWLPSSPSGTGATQNADGSVTIANPTNNHWGGQLQTWNNGQGAAFGGGGYFQATLSWQGNYAGGNGYAWPAFWMDGQEAMASAAAHTAWTEPDIMEAWGNNNWSGTLHSWSNGGATNIQTSSGGISTSGFDPSQPNTYGMLWVPATASSQGKVQWFLNGKQVGNTVTWDQGQGPYASMDAQHFALWLGTDLNPMTVSDVQVWQNLATANNIGVNSPASGCAPAPHPGQTPPLNQIAATVAIDPAAQPTGSACINTGQASGAATGGFRTVNGQIIGPDGTPFIPRGINIRSTELSDVLNGAVTAAFPGLNFVRINIRNFDDPASLAAAVNYLTSRGIVAELEVHPNGGGGQGSIAALSGDAGWYSQAAAYFKDNPRVWFGTYNEPPTDGSLSAWHQATYNAIRGAGNNNPILIEPGGSRPWNLTAPLDPSVYTSMSNIILDPHVYGYQNDYSSDPASLAANVKGMVAAAQQIRSADGTVPVIIGEYGNSTDGSTPDPNGMANVQSVIDSGVGSAAWSWVSGGSDALRNSDGSLSDYGTAVAGFIGSGGAVGGAQGCTQPPISNQTSTPLLLAGANQSAPPLQSTPVDQTPPSFTDPPMLLTDPAIGLACPAVGQ